MSQLRGSQNYIWSLMDVLGQGATGAVYRARHKKNGEVFAVKTFNHLSQMRPISVQMREFEVLKKLDHKNIVRLLAIEEETSTRSKVLIMELCTGGSLYNMLDNPENSFGILESEFFNVLNDLASGMKHIRDQGIVHRDIKPGNIMRYIDENGRSIYKLTDFGAARELQEEEEFMSLYGTEEYLYPDIYERAVLRRPSSKMFDGSVDLWSLGVTLYHLATGQLPFRPFGGRKNKETMYQITADKQPGVISGYQETENGPIKWSTDLPVNCRLSLGARCLVRPLFAGLMETNPNRMWSFDMFFEKAKEIFSHQVVHVFSLLQCEMLHVYLKSNDSIAHLQDGLASQTKVLACNQRLLFENCDFSHYVTPLQPIASYPKTSHDSPIFLFYNEQSDCALQPEFTIRTSPSFNAASLASSSFQLLFLP
ncbi:hypothetical protein CAPTEDRAFT_124995 [Capitella teleta]|uniref:Protein kinase domain-containing protein n=1 Tax=Capitella teleta TaxID=283909 RepID=R7T917_CAPTE|nr:hypothetical protein CAPTEDRAFT_124995 [Capitella teleta]|eukprot:ELT90194.1 hypothetical protein CAPTEDRAFT_124995 [Capitella teleta]